MGSVVKVGQGMMSLYFNVTNTTLLETTFNDAGYIGAYQVLACASQIIRQDFQIIQLQNGFILKVTFSPNNIHI